MTGPDGNGHTNGHANGNGNGNGTPVWPASLRTPGRSNNLSPRPPEKGNTVLITGGAGYVGCVLTERLLDRGYNVRILDRLYWGYGLEQFADRVEVIVADVRDIPATALDGIDHLAGLSSDPTAEYDPEACPRRGLQRPVFELPDPRARDARGRLGAAARPQRDAPR
jgi:hypothetical protein